MKQHSFGYWLRLQRKALDLTREELAERVGYSAATIRKIEAEERHPSAQIVERLAEIFNISPNERTAFLKFARGDWASAPHETVGEMPWRASTISTRSNLSATVTSLVGREQEIVDVREYLLKEDIRLVTLIGPPGIGKTRLSIESARASLSDFTDGVFFVALALLPLGDPNLIASAVVQALGFIETGNLPADKQLMEGIGDKHMLIVLDNCEHIIEHVASLATSLLSACSRLKFLATSRESLRIPGEWLYPVPAFDIPEESSSIDMESVSKFPALTLFTERARAVRPDFVVNADNIQTVAMICARLDGLPLVIELIAARMRLMSPQALLERLSSQFVLTADGMRAASERQKTLNDAIGWSYSLLSAEEQRLFASLSVFSGGFTLEAAEAMFSRTFIEKRVSNLIALLLDKSLLQPVSSGRGEPHYTMLMTIQEFARDRLRETGEQEEIRNRHLAYFLALAEKADLELRGPNQLAWLNRLNTVRDNLRTALEWSLESQPEFGLQMAAALIEFWDTHAHITEASKWLEAMLKATNHLSATPSRVTAIYGAMWLAIRQTEIARGQSLLEEGLALAQALGYKRGIAQGLAHGGRIKELFENDLEHAEPLYNDSLEIWRELGDKLGIGQALGPLASCALNRHDYARAEGLFNESLALFREVGNEREIAGALWNLSEVAIFRGAYASAQALAEESLALYSELEDKHGIATALRALSVAVHNQGNVAQARTASEQSVEIFREISDRGCMGITLSVLARQVYEQGNLQRAAELGHESIAALHEDKVSISSALDILGRITLAQQNSTQARQYFRDGLILQRDLKDTRMVPSLLEGLAHNFAASARPQAAIRLLGAAEALREEFNLAMMQIEHPEYDNLVSMLQKQIDAVTYQKKWAEGRAMTLEQAIDYAMSGDQESGDGR